MPTETEAMQRHHDHYVLLHLDGKLTPEDQLQYDLAMNREREGLVQGVESKRLQIAAEEVFGHFRKKNATDLDTMA